jgi:hypothetical protein
MAAVMKELEAENTQLKKLFIEVNLNGILNEGITKKCWAISYTRDG